MTARDRCTRELPKALALRGHVYEHGRCRQCFLAEPANVGGGGRLTTIQQVIDIYLERSAQLKEQARNQYAGSAEAEAEAYDEICAVLAGLVAAGRCK